MTQAHAPVEQVLARHAHARERDDAVVDAVEALLQAHVSDADTGHGVAPVVLHAHHETVRTLNHTGHHLSTAAIAHLHTAFSYISSLISYADCVDEQGSATRRCAFAL